VSFSNRDKERPIEPESNQELVCGVERDVIENFLELIKASYSLIDDANHFLEINTGVSGINITITNQRDALSHLYTILTKQDLTHQDRLDQLSTLEEHLRRSIIEPYARAIALTSENVGKVYEAYKVEVLPLKEVDATLNSAPSQPQINARLRKVNDSRLEARKAKRQNKLDEGWLDGVNKLIDAFEQFKDIESTLENYLIRARQIKATENQKDIGHTINNDNKKQTRLSVWSIIATVLAFIFGVLITMYLSKAPAQSVSKLIGGSPLINSSTPTKSQR
jgi:hypothetical protein